MQRGRSGAQALVESALVFPLLLVASLGVLQFALYEHALDVLSAAVQEGARLAAEDGRSLDDGLDRTRELVVRGLGSAVQPIQPRGRRDNDTVQVSLDTELRPIVPLPVRGGLPLHVEAKVARERFRPGGGAP